MRSASAILLHLATCVQAQPSCPLAGEPQQELSRGLALSRRGDTRCAVEAFLNAAAAQPRSVLTWINLGLALARAGRYDEAVEPLERALAIEPHHADARSALAKVQIRRRDFARALDLLSGVEPSAETSYLRGLCHRHSNRMVESEEAFRSALRIDPAHAGAHYELGAVLARDNRLDEAQVHLRRARELNPRATAARYELANVLRRLDQSDEAQQEFDAIAGSLEMKTELSVAAEALRTGRADEAAKLYARAIGRDGRNADLRYDHAIALGLLGRKQEQLRELQTAIAIRPAFARAHHEIGVWWMHASDSTRAIASWRTALAQDPELAEAANNLAVALAGEERPGEAEKLLRHAIATRPDYADARKNLGLVLASQNRFDEARKELEEAKRLAPGNESIEKALAAIAVRPGSASPPTPRRQ